MDWKTRRLAEVQLLILLYGTVQLPHSYAAEQQTLTVHETFDETEAIALSYPVPNSNYTVYVCTKGRFQSVNSRAMICQTEQCDFNPLDCKFSETIDAECSETPDYHPDVDSYIAGNPNSLFAVLYDCPPGKVWMSGNGEPQLSVCENGFWTPINDFCGESDCRDLPDDCSDIADLGIGETHWYYIYSTKNLENGPTKVFCEFKDGSLGDSGWTTIFYYRNDVYEPGAAGPLPAMGGLYNDHLNTVKEFSISIGELYGIAKAQQDQGSALIFQFLIETSTDFFHATYDNVTIIIDNSYKLATVGNYHGDAGNAFKENEGQFFIGTSEGNFGWFNSAGTGSRMLPGNVVWKTLPEIEIPVRTQVRVRPAGYDAKYACPLVLPFPNPSEEDPSWEGTTVKVVYDRAPDASFTYNCVDGYKEGEEGSSPRTTSGVVLCEEHDEGHSPPSWNYSAVLPCTVSCPAGFIKNNGKCYKVSTEGHPLGYVGAAKSCSSDGGTLATYSDFSFLSEYMNPYEFYYTAHARRGSSLDILPELEEECFDDCSPVPGQECVSVDNKGQLIAHSCHLTDMKYICMFPGRCPSDFKFTHGRCITVTESVVDVINGFLLCDKLGATLAVPLTISEAEAFMQEAIAQVDALPKSSSEPESETPPPPVAQEEDYDYQALEEEPVLTIPLTSPLFFLGNNDVWGNWTIGNYYDVQQDIVDLMESVTGSHWRGWKKVYLSVGLEVSSIPIEVEVPEEGNDGHGVCEYPGGPIDCWEDPPLPKENMIYEVVSMRFGEVTNYRCDRGYFVDEEQTITVQPIKCYGQLGGWLVDEILPCLPSNCKGDPPHMKNMNFTVEGYVAGNFTTYECEPGYILNHTNASLSNTTQNIKCYGTAGGWTIDPIQPCNPSQCLDNPPEPLEHMTLALMDSYYMGDNATYRCDIGYFVNGTKDITKQNVSCLGSLGGWPEDSLLPCLPVEVCPRGHPVPQSGNYYLHYLGVHQYISCSVMVTCPENMTTLSGVTTQYTNCSYEELDNGTIIYLYKPTWLESCNVCDTEPFVKNATTNWSPAIRNEIYDSVTVVCEANHALSPTKSTGELLCSADGWEEIPGCYEACNDDPPKALTNMNMTSEIGNKVGTVLNYTCDDGFYIPTEEHLPDIPTNTTVTCGPDRLWKQEDSPLECVPMCNYEPEVENATTLWTDTRLWMDRDRVEVFCIERHEFEYGVNKSTVKCKTTGWQNIGGCHEACTFEPPEGTQMTRPELTANTVGTVIEYTCVDDLKLKIIKDFLDITNTARVICQDNLDWEVEGPHLICEEPMMDPPSQTVDLATLEESEGPYWIEQTLTYYCDRDTMSDTGATSVTATYTENGWELENPNFACYEVTYLPPPLAPVGSMLSNFDPPYHVNSTLDVKCEPDRISNTGQDSSVFIYELTGWLGKEPDFKCIYDPNASIPPPTTEPPFRFPDANVLENGYDKTTAVHMPSLEHFLTNANEDAPEFMLTAGPFGFGYAVALNSGDRQCLMRKNYAVSDDCSHNPKDCTTGFSMSIWERLNISFDVFHTIHKYHEDEKRYVLSTGGDHNGHPGVSIYHQGLYLIAVVSTGDEYWEVKVLGPVAINEWNNIGIRWIKGDGSSGGLELYVNARKVGQVHEGKSAVAKAELAPTELLIGCHRDADDAVYRHYNDADFDEFALWTEWLDDEETIYFLGGYEGESENLDPEEFAVMLERTNLRDPEQAAIAMAMFNGMADQLKDKNNTTGEEGNSTELNEGAKKLKGLADAFAQLTNPHLIKRDLTLEELESYAAIIDAASKMFDESLETDWDDIEATGHRGSIGVKKDLEEYIKTICKKLKFDGQPLNFTRTTDNIAVKIDKMTVSDFKGLGKFYITPNFRESKQMLSLQSAWDLPSDKVEVPTDVISDPRCRDHPISVATAYYDTFDDVGPSTINPEEMNAMVDNEVDSRVISVDIVSDATDLASPSTCEPEKKKLEKNPLFITKEHKMKNFTQRSLKFHEGENTSPIYRRICVWWNYTIGVQGAWDATGCSLLVTNQFFSKCACAHSGTFSIIAEYLEEREVMEEPYWATVVKYIGHILSAICIVFYVLVVGLSGDLKDQFHISGVFLALSVLGGGIALLISDSDRIRDGRHSCTAIGSLIHALYLNAAAWVAMIGHAGFKAVTGGIIGGFMNPYIMISSGVTLVSVGFTYLFFIFDLGTDPRCFISWFNEIKFLFFFPVLAYAMAGIFFNCVIYFNTSHASKTKKLIMHDYGNFALGSTFMIFYFTLVWILGFMSYMRFEEELGAYPWFQVFNSFMGVVILIGLGLCSTKFKMVLAGQAKRRRELLQKLHLGQGKNVGGNKLKNDVGPAPTQIKS